MRSGGLAERGLYVAAVDLGEGQHRQIVAAA